MRFLLDTNVLSEPARPNPEPRVVDWLRAQNPLDLAISVLTLGEIERGVVLLRPSKRRDTLERWLALDLPRQFLGRVLGVDIAVALSWGKLSAKARNGGRDLPVIDGLLLATAAARGLVFVTRNDADCRDRGVPLLNPWTEHEA